MPIMSIEAASAAPVAVALPCLGEAYQFDWSHEYARLAGATTKVKAAHMRLCHSRMYLVSGTV